jgi:hypothetical protein
MNIGLDADPVSMASLSVFWSTPNAVDICNYVWDTTVAAVTEPWPQHDLSTLDLDGWLAVLNDRTSTQILEVVR